jgi:hypothetical protein
MIRIRKPDGVSTKLEDMFAPVETLEVTYVDEGDYNSLDSDEASHGVYHVAKFGLCEDPMVQSQDAGFDKEQCPRVYNLVCIPVLERRNYHDIQIQFGTMSSTPFLLAVIRLIKREQHNIPGTPVYTKDILNPKSNGDHPCAYHEFVVYSYVTNES